MWGAGAGSLAPQWLGPGVETGRQQEEQVVKGTEDRSCTGGGINLRQPFNK